MSKQKSKRRKVHCDVCGKNHWDDSQAYRECQSKKHRDKERKRKEKERTDNGNPGGEDGFGSGGKGDESSEQDPNEFANVKLMAEIIADVAEDVKEIRGFDLEENGDAIVTFKKGIESLRIKITREPDANGEGGMYSITNSYGEKLGEFEEEGLQEAMEEYIRDTMDKRVVEDDPIGAHMAAASMMGMGGDANWRQRKIARKKRRNQAMKRMYDKRMPNGKSDMPLGPFSKKFVNWLSRLFRFNF